MLQEPIGTTKGPGETPNEYTFITRDPEQRVKYGEFVYYRAPVEGEMREILARVSRREPIRLYPDTFFADPTVPPQEMGRLLGYDQPSDLFQITATILGYYDPALGFVNPRTPPPAGTPIYIAPDEMLKAILCRRQVGEEGAIHIGSLLSRARGRVPIMLDARGFTSTHLAIIASTGAGKSYLAGVILEELMKPTTRAAVLVIDPHAEYHTLAEMENHPAFAVEDYRPRVKIIHPDDIKVRVSSLDLGDLRYLLPNLSERMHYLLGQAYRRVRREYGDKWTRAHLRMAIRQGISEKEAPPPEEEGVDEDSTVGALIWRVNSILESKIFDDFLSLPLGDLFCPGQCTILQLNEIAEREQQIVVATLLRRLNQARVDTVSGRAQPGDEHYLPYPAFVMIEEAHHFAPANAEIVTTNILKQILSEGRKFGVAVGLISQRPGKLDSDVLSQCMTQCIMRIVNPVDQARIAESVESVGRDLLMELPGLTKGQVIIAGTSVNTPLLAQVRLRLTRHGAEDPNAPREWQAYFREENAAQRARDAALPEDGRRGAGRGRLYKTTDADGEPLPF
ncbi:MAG: ATP-binding protein [Chloroflexi bacterium]|nr:ATP-binding protein [Chloroflexota bacterium]